MHEEAPLEDLRGATRRATTSLVDLALAEQVDFVIIAGDIFDGDWPDVGTGLFFNKQMGRLQKADIPVYLIKGNHDAESVITGALTYPSNVHEFSTAKVESMTIDSLPVALHGRGFPERKLTENIVPEYPKAVPGKYNIGLLHTSLAGSSDHDTYAPCSLDELELSGYDYWALGHIHIPEIKCKNPWIAYSGNTQGRHIRETGERGCFLVSVSDAGETSAEFCTLDCVRWFRLEVDITGVDTTSGLLELVDETIEAALGSGLSHIRGNTKSASESMIAVLRIVVSGSSTLASRLELKRDHYRDEFLSVAQRHNNGNVWLETVRLQVKSALNPASDSDVNDSFASEVLAALQPDKLHETFARSSWNADIDKVLKDLNAEQLAEVEQQLPAALRKSVADSEGGFHPSQDEEGSEHLFYVELRNLALSALDLPVGENDSNAATGADAEKSTRSR